MKEFLLQEPDPVVSSETYLGTRMNQKALDFHTQLHDWSEAQKLSALANKHTNILSSAKNGEVFLPVKKLAQIEYWTRQVNRYYRPNRSSRPRSGSFMKIDVTKYNMKVDKNEPSRSKSAIYPNRQRPVSAVSRLTSGPRRRFFGNDVHTVNNKLVESQMHYSAQRKDLYSAKTRNSTKSAKTDEVKSDFPVNDANETDGSEKADSDSETITNVVKTDASKISDLDAQGQSHINTGVIQPQIVSRSWSNRMLNVISIDDCKLTCRYRPQMIKENHPIPDDLDFMQKARANKLKYDIRKINESKVKAKVVEKEEEEEDGNEADDEGHTSEDTAEVVGSMERLSVNEIPVDTNNNTTANACHNNTVEKAERNLSTVETNNMESIPEVVSGAKTNGKSTSSGSTANSDRYHVRKPFDSENNRKDLAEEHGTSSQGASKTSYGRITTLYTNSENSKPNARDEKRKKKISRTSRINYAINDMVQERKVMNSLERDFDTRTAEFGRTIIDKTEGSETFKKIHANLRKKIDAFVDAQCAVKTKEFYERSRSNSAANSITSP